MGWVRVYLTPGDRANLARVDPALLSRIEGLNREANRLDPLTRPSAIGDAEEYEGEAKDRGFE